MPSSRGQRRSAVLAWTLPPHPVKLLRNQVRLVVAAAHRHVVRDRGNVGPSELAGVRDGVAQELKRRLERLEVGRRGRDLAALASERELVAQPRSAEALQERIALALVEPVGEQLRVRLWRRRFAVAGPEARAGRDGHLRDLVLCARHA